MPPPNGPTLFSAPAGVVCSVGSPRQPVSHDLLRRTLRRQLSSPGFYAACSASPPPPLSLVFGAGALASRMAVFERLGLLRAAAGRSASREVRARVAEKEVRKGMASGVGSEQLLAGEKSALGKLEVCMYARWLLVVAG